ncbi:hypothetical protein [Methylobacterium sp. CM6246]
MNRLVSRSVTHAGNQHKAPLHGATELLRIIEERRALGHAIEFIGSTDSQDEIIRASNGYGHDFIRIKDCKFFEGGDSGYAVLFFEHADYDVKSLSVIDTRKLIGRELSGDQDEVGASTAHVVVKLPRAGSYDDGSYRCAIEYIHGGVSRKYIAALLRRQLRRHAQSEGWEFEAFSKDKKGKPIRKNYRYWPKLDLLADVSRSLDAAVGVGRELSHLIFTKRSEKHATGQATTVLHEEFRADVEMRVNVSQGPGDPAERRNWAQRIVDDFKHRGFQSEVFYRSTGNATIGGKLHEEVEGVTDLLLCPKEVISLSAPPRRWRQDIDDEVVGKLRELVDRDELWRRAG